MIELHDLTSDDDNFDTTTSSSSNLPPSTNCLSPGQIPSGAIRYNTFNIQTLLKEQPAKYVFVENQKIHQVKPSPCWNRFALPAVKDENDRNVIIKNFATCRHCYTTYSYTYGSTKSLNSHKCSKESPSISASVNHSK